MAYAASPVQMCWQSSGLLNQRSQATNQATAVAVMQSDNLLLERFTLEAALTKSDQNNEFPLPAVICAWANST